MKPLRFRRFYLDKALNETVFQGKVLDVGGKKLEKRGDFTPPLDMVDSWEYLNIDDSTRPDYLCSADTIPVEDNSFDMIVMTEVLEHLESPEKVLRELWRVLKDNGMLIASMPFLSAFHVRTGDFQRWTHMKIRSELERTGFRIETIDAMGGIVAVVIDLVASHVRRSQTFFARKVTGNFIQIISPLLLFFDKRSKSNDRITTGHFIRARKML